MRSIDKGNYPKHLNRYPSRTALADEYITKAAFYKEWENYLTQKRLESEKYLYPEAFWEDITGRLLVNLTGEMAEEIPLNILLFQQKNNRLIAIYRGDKHLSFKLSRGDYKL